MTRATAASDRVRVRRRSGRGRYDREAIEAILDAGLVGHLAIAHEGQPYAIPMLYARCGELLYLHGSPLSRVIGRAGRGTPVCFTVTLLDGIVLARSAFHHSVNYRSVVVLGQVGVVTDEGEKRMALDTLVEHVAPGRTAEARGPSAEELAATEVLALALEEVSAKARTGPPIDAPDDYALPVWAGEIPLAVSAGGPISDPRCSVGPPGYVQRLVASYG